MSVTFLRSYAHEVLENLDYLITWPISTDVKLGDVGVIEDGIFKRIDTLKERGIHEPLVREGIGTTTLLYNSNNGVELAFDANAESAVQGLGAKVEIKFSREGAVFLRIGDHVLKQFETLQVLGEEVMQRYRNGNWERNRVIVTEVITASAATILVSGNNSSAAIFQLEASLPLPQAMSKGKFSQLLGLTGSFNAQVIGENVSPLFRTSGLRRNWLNIGFKSDLDVIGSDDPAILEFGRVDIL
jgi:hypothetical protein